ncbi:MAG TPA: response regulator [Candidatus Angelobacter sp.]|nr:response regulator [Candidatus Angelobacter sp.]
MIKVLIVEDDPMVAQINKTYLESIPEFLCAGTVNRVPEALAFLKETPVELVLLDLFMPGKNGLDLLVQLRKNHSNIDVLVISAASDIQTIKSALRLGAVDYLIKPFEFERFRSALMRYLREQTIAKDQNLLSQNELDQLIWPERSEMEATRSLPKGLTVETLKRTVQEIENLRNQPFSTEGLANLVGISRVSMRKYLKFLTDLDYVSLELDYGATGRPVNRYELNIVNKTSIRPFIGGS